MSKSAKGRAGHSSPVVENLALGDVANGPVAIVKTVVEPDGMDEHEGARLVHGALVHAMRFGRLAGRRVRLVITAEVIG